MKNHLKSSFVILFTACLFNWSNSFGQKFDKFKDAVNDCFVIEYYVELNQLIIQKHIPFDSTKTPYYRVGIFVTPQNVLYEQFMKRGAMIVFEDSSKIILKNETRVVALGNDSYQISAILDLSIVELQHFINHKIKYFRIHNYLHTFDKWQPKNVQEAFVKIKTEQY